MHKLCHCERSEAIQAFLRVSKKKTGLPRRLTPARNDGFILDEMGFESPPNRHSRASGNLLGLCALKKQSLACAGMTSVGALTAMPGITAWGGQTHA